MPSILQSANRHVLHYYRINGIEGIILILHIINYDYIMLSLELEQYFINTLKLNLNVDLFSNNTGFNEPAKLS